MWINPGILRDLRKLRGFTQEKLAEKVGVRKRTEQRWEAGDSEPGKVRVELLIEVLDTDEEYLTATLAGGAEVFVRKAFVQVSHVPNRNAFREMDIALKCAKHYGVVGVVEDGDSSNKNSDEVKITIKEARAIITAEFQIEQGAGSASGGGIDSGAGAEPGPVDP